MNAAEALRSIRFGMLSYIQQKVKVDFDNGSQLPLYFFHGRHRYTVNDVLGRFRLRENGSANGFLLKADDSEVYFLYFHGCAPDRSFSEGCWVLSFRVLSDRELMSFYREERQMLVNTTVKRVVNFHGHLCPDLVIGMKACEYALALLFQGEQPHGPVSVIAENSTSALDAFQVLLGATLGNHALQVFDVGKHNYTFSKGGFDRGFTLRYRGRCFANEVEYAFLKEKILNNETTLDEVVRFQQILDSRVSELLSVAVENLFEVAAGAQVAGSKETPTVYVSCSRCGQQVLRERAIEFQEKIYCIPCFQSIEPPAAVQSLH
jgi:formylmethanofuran dehydrogenase subunit E